MRIPCSGEVLRSGLAAAALSIIALSACGGGEDAGYGAACPNFQSQPTCPVAPGATCINNNPTIGCALDALPAGLQCEGEIQCGLTVMPCPNEVQTWAGGGRVDAYICSCVNERWACDDCYLGQATCGGPSNGAEDSGPDGASGGFADAVPLRLDRPSLECLPQPLPTSSTGQTTCALVLEGLTSDCATAGLSPATSQELALLTRGGPLPGGSTCELDQLGGTAGSGCSDEQSTGWCYVAGSCQVDAGTACTAAICTTHAFDSAYLSSDASGVLAVLACP